MYPRRPLIDIYPVGVLADLIRLGRAIRSRQPQLIRWALGKCWYEVRYLAQKVRYRQWRELKNAFNGYLAEHRTRGYRCGHGWTRRRALRDLYRHLAEYERE